MYECNQDDDVMNATERLNVNPPWIIHCTYTSTCKLGLLFIQKLATFWPSLKNGSLFLSEMFKTFSVITLNALVCLKNIVISSIYRILLGPTPELDHPSLDRIHPKTVWSHVEQNDSQTPGHVLLVSEMIDCSQSDCFFSIRLLEGERA